MSRQLITFVIISVLLALAFFLRWQYVLNTKIINPIRADARQYVKLAENLAHHHVYSMSIDPEKSVKPERPPGYPVFLAAIVALTSSFQSFYWTTLLVQCLIGSGIVVLTYVLAGYVLPKVWAFITAILVAFSPHMIALSAYFLTECLYTFLLLGGIVFFIKAFRKESSLVFVVSGLAFGLAILVRPALALFPLLAGAIIYLGRLRNDNRRETATIIVFFLIACFLLPAGWYLWQNMNSPHRPSNNSLFKAAVVCGTYPQITYQNIPGMPYREDPDFNKLMAAGYPEIINRVIEQTVKEPGRYLGWWFIGKPVMFWSWKVFFNDGINVYPVQYTWFDNNFLMGAVRWLMLNLHSLLVIMAALSIFFFFRGEIGELSNVKAVTVLLCLALMIYFTLIFMVLAPFPRYALPLGPELFTLSVLSIRKLALASKKVVAGRLA